VQGVQLIIIGRCVIACCCKCFRSAGGNSGNIARRLQPGLVKQLAANLQPVTLTKEVSEFMYRMECFFPLLVGVSPTCKKAQSNNSCCAAVALINVFVGF